jgi:hypothetical protein
MTRRMGKLVRVIVAIAVMIILPLGTMITMEPPQKSISPQYASDSEVYSGSSLYNWFGNGSVNSTIGIPPPSIEEPTAHFDYTNANLTPGDNVSFAFYYVNGGSIPLIILFANATGNGTAISFDSASSSVRSPQPVASWLYAVDNPNGAINTAVYNDAFPAFSYDAWYNVTISTSLDTSASMVNVTVITNGSNDGTFQVQDHGTYLGIGNNVFRGPGFNTYFENIVMHAYHPPTYVPRTVTIAPTHNQSAQPYSYKRSGNMVGYGVVGTSSGITLYSAASLTDTFYVRSWNGLLNAYAGGEILFLPGATNTGVSAISYSLGTVYANITYGSRIATWQHTFNYSATVGGTLYSASIAPQWNISAYYSGPITLSLTITDYPGEPYYGSGNTPASPLTYAVSGNGQDNPSTSLVWSGSTSPTAIPFAHGWNWTTNYEFFTPPAGKYYVHYSTTVPTDASYDSQVAAGTNGQFPGVTGGTQMIGFMPENTSSGQPYQLTLSTESYPRVTIVSSADPGDAEFPVTFTAETTGSGVPFSYSWSINGSAMPGNSSEFNHTFASAGSYNVSVIVTDTNGNANTSYMIESINPALAVSIVAGYLKVDVSVQDIFSAQVSGGTGGMSYAWSILGSAFSQENTSYSFNHTGYFYVNLTVTDGIGNTASASITVQVYSSPLVTMQHSSLVASLLSNFNASVTDGLEPYTLSWNISGNTYSGTSISHTFSSAGIKEIRIGLKDGAGFSGTFYFNVSVNLFVSISDTAPIGVAPLAESFSSSVLGGGSPPAYSFKWSFGNGQESVQQNPSESFNAGNYTVNLTVSDAQGSRGYAEVLLMSLPEPVALSYSPTINVTVLTPVSFLAKPSWYPQNSSTTWILPNGQEYSSPGFQYTFPVYAASNIVEADFYYSFNGTSYNYSASLDVRMVPSLPVIVVSGLKDRVTANSTLALSAAQSYSYDAQIVEYQWSYGNITFSGPKQSFSFRSLGSAKITLKVVDSLEATASETLTVQLVKPAASANISMSVRENVSTPNVIFTVKTVSSYAVQDVEAVITGPSGSGETFFASYESGSGNTTYWSLALNEYNYSSGTYDVQFVAFTANDSNYSVASFSVSPSLVQPTTGLGLNYIVNALGGPTGFLTLVGVLIAAITVAVSVKQRGTQVVDIGSDQYESKPGGNLKRVKKVK